MKLRTRLTDPQQAHELFSFILEEPQEVLACCYLTSRNDVIAVREVFRGTLRGTAASPREILRIALECNAGGLLVAHNHPSGDLMPSPEDHHFTETLGQACRTMGLILVDHLIVGPGNSFYSINLEQTFAARRRRRLPSTPSLFVAGELPRQDQDRPV